ncbi:glycosyltransferase family 2 protein [Patescibacteria group bacterium]|nr:glycosyltransferase family 2 protein [Patescibacteria group bacterium]
MSISIIIPFYNEEDCIEDCILQTKKVFKKTDYEIIAVNDGSKDNSHNIVSKITETNPKIKCISCSQNKGYSNAIQEGIKNSIKDYVSFIDADLQYPPEELMKMYDFALKNDLKFVIGAPQKKYQKPIRMLLSSAYNSYIALLFGLKLKDANSLKLMKRENLEKINFRYGYGMIEIEVLLGFKMQGIPINTYPINVRERIAGKSKCSFKIIYRTLIDCAKLRFLKNKLLKNVQPN